MKTALLICCLASALCLTTPASAQNLKPAQAAYLKGEVKRAQERFVTQAAAISGVPAAKIREWVPTDGRDVPPKLSVIQALERARGKALSDEERARIVAADQERFDTIAQARVEASRR